MIPWSMQTTLTASRYAVQRIILQHLKRSFIYHRSVDLPLDLLRTLAAVVDAGTLERAAAQLGVTPSAVSQRIRALERQLGRVLLTRTRPVRPTPDGTVLLRLGRQLALLEHEALIALGRTAEGDALLREIASRRWHDIWGGVAYQAKYLLARGKPSSR